MRYRVNINEQINRSIQIDVEASSIEEAETKARIEAMENYDNYTWHDEDCLFTAEVHEELK